VSGGDSRPLTSPRSLRLILEAASASLELVPRLLPEPFDHTRVVVAVAEVVVQRRKAMLLAGLFHMR